MKVGNNVKVLEDRYLLGRVGTVVKIDGNAVLVDFHEQIVRDGFNILHNGGLKDGKPTHFWFREKNLQVLRESAIHVMMTYILPEWGHVHKAATYTEYEPISVQAAIENALLETGLSRRPELVVSVTATRIEVEEV